jgi:hypothetical protein
MASAAPEKGPRDRKKQSVRIKRQARSRGHIDGSMTPAGRGRRADIRAIAISLGLGCAVMVTLLVLQEQGVIRGNDIGAGSLVWTIAVAGLGMSAVGQLILSIVHYRRARTLEMGAVEARTAYPAE